MSKIKPISGMTTPRFADIATFFRLPVIKDLHNLDYCIFAGGGILKNQILNLSTKFIHLHPGITPYYRGSTCFYYSILKENYAGVTAYIMDKNLDTGPILFQKKFQKPNHKYLDDVFDPYIRSETLIELLKNKTTSFGHSRNGARMFGLYQ